MFRGGRGGGRGGFQGGRSALENRFGVDHDPAETAQDTKPSETFPDLTIPVAPPPSHAELHSVHHYRSLRARIHDGPFYCILDSSALVHKSQSERGESDSLRAPAAAHFNAFDDQETYTQRFRKKRNALPNLKNRPFVREFFPRELWRTMGVERGVGAAATAEEEGGEGRERKRLKISEMGLDKWEREEEGETQGGGGGGEEGDGEEKEDEEGDGERDEEDEDKDDADPDQFEDDDEEDDYNAEQYFEGGEEDDYGDDGGGGGDEDY